MRAEVGEGAEKALLTMPLEAAGATEGKGDRAEEEVDEAEAASIQRLAALDTSNGAALTTRE